MDALLTLVGYNTFMVSLGAMSLGIAGGVVGLLVVQRGQSLLADVLAHAALPGIAIVWGLLGGVFAGPSAAGMSLESHPMALVLLGGAGSACLGVICLRFMAARRSMTLDLSFAAILSVFFGAGLVLMSWLQSLEAVGTAGLSFLFLGQITSLTGDDLALTFSLCGLACVVVGTLHRPLRHLCFDETHARLIGLPTLWLDRLILALALCVALSGVYLVGLILTVAMLIVPAASAQFWVASFRSQIVLSAVFGGLSGFGGALISAQFQSLPSGPIIVLFGGGILGVSLVRHAVAQHA